MGTTDGTTLAWLAATERDAGTGRYGHLELWAATYDGESLDARRVRDIELLQNGIVGGDYFVRVDRDPSDGAQVYAVYRLTDGAVAYVRPPTEQPAQQVVQVSNETLIFQVFDTVFRIDPTSLTFD